MLWSRFTDNFATVWESIKIRLYPRCCFAIHSCSMYILCVKLKGTRDEKTFVCRATVPCYWITTRQLNKPQQNLTRLICQSLHSGIHASSNNLACSWRKLKAPPYMQLIGWGYSAREFSAYTSLLGAALFSVPSCLVRLFSRRLAWHRAFD